MKAIRLNQAIIILSSIGMFIAGVLTLAHYSNALAPCSMTVSCAKVTDSVVAMIGPVPLAAIGLLAYIVFLAFAVARIFVGFKESQAYTKLTFGMAAFGALTSLGLIIYSRVIVEAMCEWCVGSAFIMFFLFVTHYLLMGAEAPETKGASMPDIGIIGGSLFAAAISVMMVGSMMKPKSMMRDIEPSLLPTIIGQNPHVAGNPNGIVTLVEFADLSCPSCRRSYPKMKGLTKKYPQLKFVFRHYPLWEMPGHEKGLPAALVSEVAAGEGKFWEFMDIIMDPSKKLVADEQITAAAGLVGLKDSLITQAMNGDQGPWFDKVWSDRNDADKLGLNATPTYFVIWPDGKIVVLGQADLDTLVESKKWQDILGGK
ncbi:MAG: vitamin K epoxide reductase family protein [Fimbriimonadaceae bacterium]|nr:vitamin K epoxide reductase family protein [Fimbriimonadaceae bacterium]